MYKGHLHARVVQLTVLYMSKLQWGTQALQEVSMARSVVIFPLCHTTSYDDMLCRVVGRGFVCVARAQVSETLDELKSVQSRAVYRSFTHIYIYIYIGQLVKSIYPVYYLYFGKVNTSLIYWCERGEHVARSARRADRRQPNTPPWLVRRPHWRRKQSRYGFLPLHNCRLLSC